MGSKKRSDSDTPYPALPEGLYERASAQLMINEPLRAWGNDVLRADEALSEGELDALRSVGIAGAPWKGDDQHDPLLQSVADYMALLETSLTTAEAAKFLKVDPSRIRQRLRERSLYGVDYDGEKRLPRFQFERHKVLPGLSEVLHALPAQLNPLDVAEWFLAPNPDLEVDDLAGPLSPRQWLLRGGSVAAVAALAQISFA